MCGFAALIDFYGSEDLRDRISAMLASIVHRGPDDAGIEVDGPVALGFRRLSILDLSPAGHQPMQSADGNCTIVFNGEIYNYLELRAELILRGHSFKSTGDTEVLLAAYHEWGEDCLHRLNGMWAFLIHDRKRQLLFGSRDRFGIKPLFRFQDGRRAIFSSEIKAIRASGLYTTELNLSACAAHLHEGRQDQTSATYYQGIQQIPAGHAFELRLEGGYREWKYWDVLHCQTAAPEDPPQAFAELFEDAMRVHMRSDVPVGVNLSGGLDSTSILCAAARLRQESGASKDLLAFCYQDRGFDESAYIRDTLGLTGATLVPLELTPEQLWDSLPTVLSFQDEPVHSMTALVGFHLMALAARNGVKVILNGQGADEVIGGYGSYFNDRWSELIRSGHAREAWQEISDYSQAHGGAAGPRFRRALQHVVQSALGTLQPYRAVARRRRLTRARAREWLRPELLDHLPPPLPLPPTKLCGVLADSLYREPLPLYLRVEDRNSMAHSIEVRLPFLDHRLVSLVFAMGSKWKVTGPWNKHVMREAMRGKIPESVRSRVDKMGFPTNAAAWFRGPLYPRLREIFNDPSFRQQPIFDADALLVDLEAHRSGAANNSDRLFAAAQFHLWQYKPA